MSVYLQNVCNIVCLQPRFLCKRLLLDKRRLELFVDDFMLYKKSLITFYRDWLRFRYTNKEKLNNPHVKSFNKSFLLNKHQAIFLQQPMYFEIDLPKKNYILIVYWIWILQRGVDYHVYLLHNVFRKSSNTTSFLVKLYMQFL